MPVTAAPRRLAARLAILALAALTGFAGCASRLGVHRYDRESLQASLDDPGATTLNLGTFPLLKVIDGDTVKVAGLDATLRLLAIDTEETFKKEKERRAFEMGWERYLAEAEAKSRGPVKIPTPLGEDAKHFAKDFFKGIRDVRLERDHPKEIRGRFNRFLTYVFVDKDGEQVNYNLECVRAGMSPYFTKYGYSRRYHQDFVDAQAEARAAGRGIWDPAKMHYLDYDARLEWWNARADYIAAFEADAEGRDDHIILTNWDAPQRLADMVGREVVLLGAVAEVRYSETGPTRVLLSRRMFSDFPIIFFDRELFEETQIAASKGEFVRIRGVVTSWYNKYKKRDDLQIEVKLAGQVERSPVVRPGRAKAELGPEPPPPAGEPTRAEPSPELGEDPDDAPPPYEGPEGAPTTGDDPAAGDAPDQAPASLAILRRRQRLLAHRHASPGGLLVALTDLTSP